MLSQSKTEMQKKVKPCFVIFAFSLLLFFNPPFTWKFISEGSRNGICQNIHQRCQKNHICIHQSTQGKM